MRKVLIDNSTLTSVERLFGRIRVINTYHVDSDIISFENLLISILFFDELLFVDDYKPEYRERRKKFFHYIKRLEISEAEYNGYIAAASKLVDDQIWKIRAGHITTEIMKEFLELIKTTISFQWNMRSSDFFLTYRLVLNVPGEEDKYGPIFTMLSTQAYGYDNAKLPITEPVELIGSDGLKIPQSREIAGKKYIVGSEINNFINELNWLLHRTAFYLLISLDNNVSSAVHPIRSNCAAKLYEKKLSLSREISSNLIAALSRVTADSISQIRKLGDPFFSRYQLPLFSAWIAGNTRYPDQFIERAFELRDDPRIAALRKELANIEELLETGLPEKGIAAANKVLLNVTRAMQTVRASFGVETPQGIPLSPFISLINSGLTAYGVTWRIPDLGISLPKLSSNLIGKLRPSYKSLFRSIVEDITTVQRLGQLRDKLAANVRYHKDAGPRVGPTDLRRYLNRSAHWKEPM